MVSDHLLLMIYSNPDDTARLRLDKERRSLAEAFERGDFPKSQYEIIEAATLDKVLQALAEKRYSLIHFSGHGESNGILVESGDDETAVLASIERIETVLGAAKPGLSIAVFLCCFSSAYADRLIAHVPFILATVGEARDEDCVRFVESFYGRLVKGDNIETAYVHADRRVPNLNIVLLRRAEVEGRCRALVYGYRPGSGSTYYVDISAVEADIARFGFSSDELVQMMARKIHFHSFAFRYPRADAILSIGELFASFSWQDSADTIACTRLYRLRDDAPDDLAQAYVGLLLSYSDRYVAEYRSAAASLNIRYDQIVAQGLRLMLSCYEHYFDYRPLAHGESSGLSGFSPGPSRDAALFARECGAVYRAARATGCAHLAEAERANARQNSGAVVAHLEAALSSLHDLMNAAGKRVLD